MTARPAVPAARSMWIMVAILLLAAAFRFLAVDSAPPGWRDDELIEYNLDRRIADGWRPLFITEAEGHEPVYHYLHAGTLLLFGDNIVGYKWLPFAFGLITITLTYALARKMFGVKVALLTAALLAVSFWPVMYSRFGVRHIGVLPWMLAAFYLLYPSPQPSPRQGEGVKSVWRAVLAGLCLAAALMTYFAGRAVPLILIGFLIYLAVFKRSVLRQIWWRYFLAIGLAALIAAPMFIEIARTPGGEKRTEVVGGPLIALREGNVQPAIDTTLGTLGMFTFAGDPEWLYNVEHRPVFDWITGLFFYLGVIICFVRLKRIESGFALVWLIVGIAPAFVSIPAASFSHTIVALPVVYVLAAYGAIGSLYWLSDKMTRWQDDRMISRRRTILSSLPLVILSMLVALGAWLTLRDYFGTWASEYIVRFQYHAPTREVAKWLDENPQIVDVAIGTNLNELTLDPLALELDLKRGDVKARWFNPATALVLPLRGVVIFSPIQSLGEDIDPLIGLLEDQATLQTLEDVPGELKVYVVNNDMWQPASDEQIPLFDGSLGLLVSGPLPISVHPGDQVSVQTNWWVIKPVDSPVLKSFVHVLNEQNQVVVGDDRFEVNAASLQADDYIAQFSRVTLPPDLAPGQYQIEVGLYHPDTGRRFVLPDGRDHTFIIPLEVSAP